MKFIIVFAIFIAVASGQYYGHGPVAYGPSIVKTIAAPAVYHAPAPVYHAPVAVAHAPVYAQPIVKAVAPAATSYATISQVSFN